MAAAARAIRILFFMSRPAVNVYNIVYYMHNSMLIALFFNNRLRSLVLVVLAFTLHTALAQQRPSEPVGELRPLVEEFTVQLRNIQRFYNVEYSTDRQTRLEKFYNDWLARLGQSNFDSLNQQGKIDYIVFHKVLEHDLRSLALKAKDNEDTKPMVPFATEITELEVHRQHMLPLKPSEAAAKLAGLTTQIGQTKKTVEEQLKSSRGAEALRLEKIRAARAVAMLQSVRENLRTWFTFYDGYDPQFTWWAAADYRKADAALQEYSAFLSERVLGVKSPRPAQSASGGTTGEGRGRATITATDPGDPSDIVGNPVGREALLNDLAFEMIPYTPEELIAIANDAFARCDVEMKKASREMGFGDDWKKALEKVKNMYEEPGKQPEMIKKLALEAIDYVKGHDLITVPPIAEETWRMQMMTPQRQLVNPFFTGGDTISVSYPTDAMSYESKLMSMRGNNYPFSKATVFHELIPGHELQGYMASINRPYRGAAFGRSAFVTEGWSLYWELLLWDMKFQNTPEERVGALFWHMHRCARIIFSLSFHLGKMTPVECINLLVERVGFERDNAIGEVRRSFAGDYGTLYQAGYLLGGMQLYALHKELVDSGKMTNRDFHDAILRENYIPIEMMRAHLTNAPLTRDYKSTWKFRGNVTAQ
jgi:hypothetical protein